MDFENIFKVMRKLRTHEAMQITKTWANSWATSHRYHETPFFPCLLGCPNSEDSLRHYIHCDIMYSITQDVVLHEVPASATERLGLVAPNIPNLITVSCMFHAYHSIKYVRERPITNLSFQTNCQQFAGALHVAASAVCLPCRAPTVLSTSRRLPPAANAAFSPIRTYFYSMDAAALD